LSVKRVFLSIDPIRQMMLFGVLLLDVENTIVKTGPKKGACLLWDLMAECFL